MSHRLASAAVLSTLLFIPADAADADRRLKVVSSRALPAIQSVTVYRSADAKDGKGGKKPVLTITKFDEPAVLPGAGPFDVRVTPKGGIPVVAAGKLAVKAGETHELKLGDRLGTIEVRPTDESPRAEKVVVTATDDAGPDEKGHVPVQVGSDYRVEMVVPEGFYAVWVVPANGARAQRVADRLRVLAGRNVRVGE